MYAPPGMAYQEPPPYGFPPDYPVPAYSQYGRPLDNITNGPLYREQNQSEYWEEQQDSRYRREKEHYNRIYRDRYRDGLNEIDSYRANISMRGPNERQRQRYNERSPGGYFRKRYKDERSPRYEDDKSTQEKQRYNERSPSGYGRRYEDESTKEKQRDPLESLCKNGKPRYKEGGSPEHESDMKQIKVDTKSSRHFEHRYSKGESPRHIDHRYREEESPRHTDHRYRKRESLKGRSKERYQERRQRSRSPLKKMSPKRSASVSSISSSESSTKSQTRGRDPANTKSEQRCPREKKLTSRESPFEGSSGLQDEKKYSPKDTCKEQSKRFSTKCTSEASDDSSSCSRHYKVDGQISSERLRASSRGSSEEKSRCRVYSNSCSSRRSLFKRERSCESSSSSGSRERKGLLQDGRQKRRKLSRNDSSDSCDQEINKRLPTKNKDEQKMNNTKSSSREISETDRLNEKSVSGRSVRSPKSKKHAFVRQSESNKKDHKEMYNIYKPTKKGNKSHSHESKDKLPSFRCKEKEPAHAAKKCDKNNNSVAEKIGRTVVANSSNDGEKLIIQIPSRDLSFSDEENKTVEEGDGAEVSEPSTKLGSSNLDTETNSAMNMSPNTSISPYKYCSTNKNVNDKDRLFLSELRGKIEKECDRKSPMNDNMKVNHSQIKQAVEKDSGDTSVKYNNEVSEHNNLERPLISYSSFDEVDFKGVLDTKANKPNCENLTKEGTTLDTGKMGLLKDQNVHLSKPDLEKSVGTDNMPDFKGVPDTKANKSNCENFTKESTSLDTGEIDSLLKDQNINLSKPDLEKSVGTDNKPEEEEKNPEGNKTLLKDLNPEKRKTLNETLNKVAETNELAAVLSKFLFKSERSVSKGKAHDSLAIQKDDKLTSDLQTTAEERRLYENKENREATEPKIKPKELTYTSCSSEPQCMNKQSCHNAKRYAVPAKGAETESFEIKRKSDNMRDNDCISNGNSRQNLKLDEETAKVKAMYKIKECSVMLNVQESQHVQEKEAKESTACHINNNFPDSDEMAKTNAIKNKSEQIEQKSTSSTGLDTATIVHGKNFCYEVDGQALHKTPPSTKKTHKNMSESKESIVRSLMFKPRLKANAECKAIGHIPKSKIVAGTKCRSAEYFKLGFKSSSNTKSLNVADPKSSKTEDKSPDANANSEILDKYTERERVPATIETQSTAESNCKHDEHMKTTPLFNKNKRRESRIKSGKKMESDVLDKVKKRISASPEKKKPVTRRPSLKDVQRIFKINKFAYIKANTSKSQPEGSRIQGSVHCPAANDNLKKKERISVKSNNYTDAVSELANNSKRNKNVGSTKSNETNENIKSAELVADSSLAQSTSQSCLGKSVSKLCKITKESDKEVVLAEEHPTVNVCANTITGRNEEELKNTCAERLNEDIGSCNKVSKEKSECNSESLTKESSILEACIDEKSQNCKSRHSSNVCNRTDEVLIVLSNVDNQIEQSNNSVTNECQETNDESSSSLGLMDDEIDYDDIAMIEISGNEKENVADTQIRKDSSELDKNEVLNKDNTKGEAQSEAKTNNVGKESCPIPGKRILVADLIHNNPNEALDEIISGDNFSDKKYIKYSDDIFVTYLSNVEPVSEDESDTEDSRKKNKSCDLQETSKGKILVEQKKDIHISSSVTKSNSAHSPRRKRFGEMLSKVGEGLTEFSDKVSKPQEEANPDISYNESSPIKNDESSDEELNKSPLKYLGVQKESGQTKKSNWIKRARTKIRTPSGTLCSSTLPESSLRIENDSSVKSCEMLSPQELLNSQCSSTERSQDELVGMEKQQENLVDSDIEILPQSTEFAKIGERVFEKGFEVHHMKVMSLSGNVSSTKAHLDPKRLYANSKIDPRKLGKCLMCRVCSVYFSPLAFTVHHDDNLVVQKLDHEECNKREFTIDQDASKDAQQVFKDFQKYFHDQRSKKKSSPPLVLPHTTNSVVEPKPDNAQVKQERSGCRNDSHQNQPTAKSKPAMVKVCRPPSGDCAAVKVSTQTVNTCMRRNSGELLPHVVPDPTVNASTRHPSGESAPLGVSASTVKTCTRRPSGDSAPHGVSASASNTCIRRPSGDSTPLNPDSKVNTCTRRPSGESVPHVILAPTVKTCRRRPSGESVPNNISAPTVDTCTRHPAGENVPHVISAPTVKTSIRRPSGESTTHRVSTSTGNTRTRHTSGERALHEDCTPTVNTCRRHPSGESAPHVVSAPMYSMLTLPLKDVNDSWNKLSLNAQSETADKHPVSTVHESVSAPRPSGDIATGPSDDNKFEMSSEQRSKVKMKLEELCDIMDIRTENKSFNRFLVLNFLQLENVKDLMTKKSQKKQQ